jgi:hypothetical protein
MVGGTQLLSELNSLRWITFRGAGFGFGVEPLGLFLSALFRLGNLVVRD